MSTISASTLITTALQYTADTTGTLVFKTGATPTTALTLNADQSATFAGAVNFTTASFVAPVVIEGTTTSAALRVTQLGTGDALLIEDSTNPDSTPVVIDASGQVIIGSSTAISYASGITPQLQINKAGAEQVGISRFSADTGGNALTFLKSRSATIGGFDVVSSGDTLGSVFWYGTDGTTGVPAASISSAVDGTPGTSDMPGRLIFSTTADGASSVTERMRITSLGNVGIGGDPSTAATLYTLKNPTGATTVAGVRAGGAILSDVTTGYYSFYSRPSTQATAFTLTDLGHFFAYQSTIGAGSTVTNQYGFIVSSTLTGATNNYGFYSGIASGTGRYNFYATGTADNYFAGNVGIGTTTPGKNLDVAGTGRFSGTVDVGGGLNLTSNGTQVTTTYGGVTTSRFYTSTSGANISVDGSWPIIFTNTSTERMRIDSSGNVYINSTTNPFGSKLGVTSTSAFPLAAITSAIAGSIFSKSTDGAANQILFVSNNSYNYGVVGVASANGTASGDVFTVGYTPSAGSAATQVANWTSTGLFQFNSGYGAVQTAYGCRAWVNFNGTGTVAIRASGNVSSITDNGAGNYYVNFTNAMPDANFASIGAAMIGGNYTAVKTGQNQTTSRTTVETSTFSTWTDAEVVAVSIFR